MNVSQLQRHYLGTTDPNLDRNVSGGNRQKKVLQYFSRFGLRRSILDIGCFTGEMLKPLCEKHTLVGMDLSNVYVDRLIENGYMGFSVGDISDKIPFDNAQFDAVFIGECIEHIVDTDWALCEINRVLGHHGDLVLTFPNIRTPISFVAMLLNRAPMFACRYRSGHVRDFTTRSMIQALVNNGFRINGMRGVDFCFSANPHGRFPKLADRFPSWASTVVVHATKVKGAEYSVADHLRE